MARTKKPKYATREEWLLAGAAALGERFFGQRGLALPTLRCSCGWPRGGRKVLGQCWHEETSGDGTVAVFISPRVSEVVRVLDILLHEMIHAHLGKGAKHGAKFARLAADFGLAGKPTATYAEEGTALHRTLAGVARRLGVYPHSPLADLEEEKKGGGARAVRLVSPTQPEYALSLSRARFDKYGAPLDPWGQKMLASTEEGDDEEGDVVIRLLVTANPKRVGSAAHGRFALYRDGMTVREFLAAGGAAADIRWDVAHGHLELTEDEGGDDED